MNKIMALDLGDQWVGVALSDASGFIARPLTTVSVAELKHYLQKIITDENLQHVIVGLPTTMKGGESEQTKKIIRHKEELEREFPLVKFTLWDERLSSKRAHGLASKREEKLKSHARAAAFILDSYLMYLAHVRESTQ